MTPYTRLIADLEYCTQLLREGNLIAKEIHQDIETIRATLDRIINRNTQHPLQDNRFET